MGFTSDIIHYGWYVVQLENCVPGWIFPPGRYIIPKDKDLVCCPGNIFNFFTCCLSTVGVDACIDPRADASIRPYKAYA